jgi:hypothetical protein
MSATLMHAYNPTRTYTAHFTRLSPAAGFAEEDIKRWRLGRENVLKEARKRLRERRILENLKDIEYEHWDEAEGEKLEEELDDTAGTEEDIYEVETLLDKKTGRDGKEMILVRWSGYKRPTWVPRENLEEGARESLRALDAGILRKKEKEQRKEKRKKAQAEIEDRKRKAKQPASKKGEGGDVVGRAGQ